MLHGFVAVECLQHTGQSGPALQVNPHPSRMDLFIFEPSSPVLLLPYVILPRLFFWYVENVIQSTE